MIRILSIETSCDETALSVIEADGGTLNPRFTVLGNALATQAEMHAQYGGVFPNVAKREHGKIITELMGRVLTEANILSTGTIPHDRAQAALAELVREPEAQENFAYFLENYGVPNVDLICVTSGPGLEPALWVGVSFAKALAVAWQKPIMPVNHMEGHIVSVLLQSSTNATYTMPKIAFPAISLLVSGGHTEIHLVKNWNDYTILGATKDDAIGEAFDKTARLLGLPYPGGPKISAFAKTARDNNEKMSATLLKKIGEPGDDIVFPRPMIATPDFNFSYSGLKTSVLYLVKKIKEVTDQELDDVTKRVVARAFEDAALDVVITKTLRAAVEKKAKSIIVGGGVAANNRLREQLVARAKEKNSATVVLFPERELATDNALMIAMAGYFSYLRNNKRGIDSQKIVAVGNLKISK